ncbi:MAG: hypothetical protein GY950_32720 [bacterium]|nr:hypothetical protein [bacterium]
MGIVLVMLTSLYIATTTRKDLYRGLALASIIIVLVFLFLGVGVSLEAQSYGNTWNNGNLTANLVLRDVVFTGSNFVAVGDSSVVYTSADGSTWTARSSGYAPNKYAHLFGVAYGGSKVVAVGRDKLIITSDDNGATWHTSNPRSSDVYDPDINKVAYGNGIFVAVDEAGGTYRSSDGETWTTGTIGASCRDIGFGGGEFLAAGANGRVYHSTNGASWTNQYVGSHQMRIDYNTSTGTWLLVGSKIWSSGNGSTWTQRLNISTCGGINFYAVTSTPDSYIVGGENGLMVNSTNLTTWRDPDSKTQNFLFGMAYGNGIVVGVGNGGHIASSLAQYCTHYSNSGGTPAAAFSGCGGGGSASITVRDPNGGETLDIGTTYTIKWRSSGGVGNVKLRYSTNGGTNWTKFADSTPNDGSYAWTVPDEPSTNCRIRISESSDGDPFDVSNSSFTIAQQDDSTLTVTDPNGGEAVNAGSSYTVRWTSTGTVNNVKLRYSTDGGSTWIKFVDSTPNDGNYMWSVPDVDSDNCLIRISDAADGFPYDVSNSTFSITEVVIPATITVISPNGDEDWESESTHSITWASSESINSVKIDYSTNNGTSWSSVTSSTPNDGAYSWTLPEESSSQCLIRVTDTSASTTDRSDRVFTIASSEPAQIALNRTQLNFASISGGAQTGPQPMTISNSGGKVLNWTAGGDQGWISLDTTSGDGDGVLSVSVDPSGLGVGNHTGTITFTDPEADNSPQTATVNLSVIQSWQDQSPVGSFSTPLEGAMARGSIPVTGWVLDDVEIANVKIYYNQGSYIGDAVFVEGARPDIESAYPDYPWNFRAGWGYMLLTNALSDGSYTLSAVATDVSGKTFSLGSANVTIDNAAAVKPFGTIDFPAQGGEISGSNYTSSGWALTPSPNLIPKDGSTIQVWIDGAFRGTVDSYDEPNQPVTDLFPGLQNSDGPNAFFLMDTTAYANGVHIISWTVTDNAGNSEGIGSRYFNIQNTGAARSAAANDESVTLADKAAGIERTAPGLKPAPPVLTDENGVVNLEISELERVKLQFGEEGKLAAGYMVVGDQLRPLPIGSTLDLENGTFYWQAGHGFLGHYQLMFVMKTQNGEAVKKHVHLHVVAKTPGK